MLRNHAIFGVALFMAASPASAERWEPFGADRDGTTAFVDTDSIVASGNFRTFAMKYVAPSIPSVSFSLIRQQVDCVGRTVDLLHMTAYGTKGEVLLEQDDSEPARPVVPGSKGEAVFRKVCQ